MHRYHPRWLLLGLAVVVVVNLWQSATIEWGTPSHQRVLARADGDRLLDLVRSSSPTARVRFAVYLELRPFVAGGTVVVPSSPATLEPTLVRGLAGADVVTRDYDPHLDPSLADRLRDDAAFTATLRTSRGELPVVGPDDPAQVLVVLVDAADDTLYVVTPTALRQRGADVAGLDLDALADGRLTDG